MNAVLFTTAEMFILQDQSDYTLLGLGKMVKPQLQQM